MYLIKNCFRVSIYLCVVVILTFAWNTFETSPALAQDGPKARAIVQNLSPKERDFFSLCRAANGGHSC